MHGILLVDEALQVFLVFRELRLELAHARGRRAGRTSVLAANGATTKSRLRGKHHMEVLRFTVVELDRQHGQREPPGP